MSRLTQARGPTRDAWRERQAFLESPLVTALAPQPRWSVSDKDKRPIDMGHLIRDLAIRGARVQDPDATVNLKTLMEELPDAANAAFALDAAETGLCLLDVEPGCPSERKDLMLRLPYLYGEVSMSGRGLHLWFELPPCLRDSPEELDRPAIRDPRGWWEVLLSHWVTFTARALSPPANPEGDLDFNRVCEGLLRRAPRPSPKGVLDEVPATHPTRNRHWDQILEHLSWEAYPKTKDDFGGDLSRYDYGHLGWLFSRIRRLSAVFADWRPTAGELAWLLYDAAKSTLPHRPKHDERRGEVSWLMMQCQNIVASDSDPKGAESEAGG